MELPRICWIFNGPGLEATGVSGGSVRFQEIARRWREEARCEYYFITTPGGLEMHRRLGLEAPTLRLRASLLARRERFRFARIISYLLSTIHFYLVRRRVPECDVVISVSSYFCDVLPAYWLKKMNPGLKWVAWIHHRESRSGGRGFAGIRWCLFQMQRFSFRWMAELADQAWVLATSEGRKVADALVGLGMKKSHVCSMENGVDSELIAGVLPERQKVDAVMVGLRPNKGLADIIPVWKEVQRLRPGTTLRLVGNKSDSLKRVLRQVRDLGLANVITYSGPPGGEDLVTPGETYRQTKSALLFFAPSPAEGWGIALCEAFACGVPVVAYKLPVYRELFDRAYIGVPRGDTRAMARAICRVLDSPEEREQHISRGKKMARRYEWSRIARDDWRKLEAL